MEVLKVIPQAFFTLIGRVVPGATGIVANLWLFGQVWEDLLLHTFGRVIKDSATVSILLFLGASLVFGEIISLAAKQVQRIGELKFLKPKPEAEKGLYDKLRLENSEAGSLCAKIRAEFTMHNGMAVVFFICFIAYFFTERESKFNGAIPFLIMAIYEGVRGRFVRDTFQQTVEKFGEATGLKAKQDNI